MTTVRVRGMRRTTKAQIELDHKAKIQDDLTAPVEVLVHGSVRAIVDFPPDRAGPRLVWRASEWGSRDITPLLVAAAETSRKLAVTSGEYGLW